MVGVVAVGILFILLLGEVEHRLTIWNKYGKRYRKEKK